MITVKTTKYSEKEIEQLGKLFHIMEKIIASTVCDNSSCRDCQYRHICRDIVSVTEYLEEKGEEQNVQD